MVACALGWLRFDKIAVMALAWNRVSNLGLRYSAALYALTDDGIVAGHMRLHITNMIQGLNLSVAKQTKLEILLAYSPARNVFR